MSRNFGLGQRDMAKAGQVALENSAKSGAVSFSTAATNGDRWDSFTAWAKDQEVKKMENVTPELVREYGRDLAEKVTAGEMAAATAQNYVSAVNSVMAIATKGEWQSVSPTKDCGIEQRSAIRQDAPGALDRAAYSRAVEAVRDQVGKRAGAVVELARELGLRSKEASLLDARAALAEAQLRGAVTISEGSKGGREREVLITSQAQHEALGRAAQAQGEARAVMPASYACERYEALTGHAAPCAGGEIQDRAADQAARLEISAELGHGRAEVAAEYLGGRK